MLLTCWVSSSRLLMGRPRKGEERLGVATATGVLRVEVGAAFVIATVVVAVCRRVLSSLLGSLKV